MNQDSPGKALAWMATGAAVLAVGAFLSSSAGAPRRKGRSATPGLEPVDGDRDNLQNFADRPMVQSPPAEGLAAARRVDALSDKVTSTEARVQAIERSCSAERVEEVWNRVLEMRQRLELMRAQRAAIPSAESLVAQIEERTAPRLQALESRVEDHHAAIQELRSHTAQTEANVQKMIVALARLTEQIAGALPAMRLEPRKEDDAPEVAAGPGPVEPPPAENGWPLRWKSMVAAVIILLSLVGSWAILHKVAPKAVPASAVASTASPAQDLEMAIASITRLSEREPEDLAWKYELGRLYEMKKDWTQAERWYRVTLEGDPHDLRALNGLAGVLSRQSSAPK